MSAGRSEFFKRARTGRWRIAHTTARAAGSPPSRAGCCRHRASPPSSARARSSIVPPRRSTPTLKSASSRSTQAATSSRVRCSPGTSWKKRGPYSRLTTTGSRSTIPSWHRASCCRCLRDGRFAGECSTMRGSTRWSTAPHTPGSCGTCPGSSPRSAALVSTPWLPASA